MYHHLVVQFCTAIYTYQLGTLGAPAIYELYYAPICPRMSGDSTVVKFNEQLSNDKWPETLGQP